jgi:hypothetical protein
MLLSALLLAVFEMITQDSRYQQGTITRMPDMDGTYQLAVLRTVPATSSGFALYVWQAGDRPDIVAANELGDPTLWWQIFDLNPEIIDPLNVLAGTVLRLPNTVVPATGAILQ